MAQHQHQHHVDHAAWWLVAWRLMELCDLGWLEWLGAGCVQVVEANQALDTSKQCFCQGVGHCHHLDIYHLHQSLVPCAWLG